MERAFYPSTNQFDRVIDWRSELGKTLSSPSERYVEAAPIVTCARKRDRSYMRFDPCTGLYLGNEQLAPSLEVGRMQIVLEKSGES